jgi:hypothetical protein
MGEEGAHHQGLRPAPLRGAPPPAGGTDAKNAC